MSLPFQKNGTLVPGIHILTLEELELIFGQTEHRKFLIAGLKKGLSHLKECGCKKVFIDGSFVTKKAVPGDFDACWEGEGVNIKMLMNKYDTLLDLSNGRKKQKLFYNGEFFPAKFPADSIYTKFIDFFQNDRDGNPKGIVQINLD